MNTWISWTIIVLLAAIIYISLATAHYLSKGEPQINTYGLYANGKLLGKVKAESGTQAHNYWDNKHPDNMAHNAKLLEGTKIKYPSSHPFYKTK